MRIQLAILSLLTGARLARSRSFGQQRHELLRATAYSRLLEISEECMNDTQALYESSTSLEGAYAAMEQEVSETQDLLSCEDSTCTVDFAALESSSDYKSECEAAGGTIMERSASMDCTSFSFEYNNVMECTAPSCNPESIDEELNKSLQETEETVESNTGATCSSQLSGGSSESSSSGGGLSGGAIFGIVIAVLAVVGAIGYLGYRQYKKHQEEEAQQVKPGAVEEQAKLGTVQEPVKKNSTVESQAKPPRTSKASVKKPEQSISNNGHQKQPTVVASGVKAEFDA